MSTQNITARRIAPEDIRAGMFIAVLYRVTEPCIWCEADTEQRRLELPWEVQPLQVQAICLPFILVKQADGDVETLDIRRVRLTRLSSEFGRAAFASPPKKKRDDD